MYAGRMKPEEAVVYDVVTELTNNHRVSDATLARAKQVLGDQQVVDLTTVCGTNVTVAMLLGHGRRGRACRQGAAVHGRATLKSQSRAPLCARQVIRREARCISWSQLPSLGFRMSCSTTLSKAT
jgi:hypothetical protein